MPRKFILPVLAIIFICAIGSFYLHFNIGRDANTATSLMGIEQKSAPVYQIFFHSLIVYPELAFSKNDHSAKIFSDYMITKTEFEKVLQELYKNNFVLVDINSIYGVSPDGKVLSKTPEVPKGKKPLIISLDDLSYYNFMKGRGFADKLVLDQDGNVATQVNTPDGKTIITKDGDVVPILDDFIKAHPDFSINGARGVIALTGYEGILGYRIEDPSQVEKVKKIVEKLKEAGWKFASHSYSHDKSFSNGTISLADLQADTQKWENQIEPLVGNTDIFVGPFGGVFKDNDLRNKYLVSQGFRMFLGVGMDMYLHYYSDCVVMDRADIDGYRLSTTPYLLKPYFDPQRVIGK